MHGDLVGQEIYFKTQREEIVDEKYNMVELVD